MSFINIHLSHEHLCYFHSTKKSPEKFEFFCQVRSIWKAQCHIETDEVWEPESAAFTSVEDKTAEGELKYVKEKTGRASGIQCFLEFIFINLFFIFINLTTET